MRVRHEPVGEGRDRRRRSRVSFAAAERAFDVVASATALVLLSPLFAAIALAIRRDSPGPVFFRQPRAGLHGRPFEFLKFRTMHVDNDDSAHQDYVCRLIENGEMACADENGSAGLQAGRRPARHARRPLSAQVEPGRAAAVHQRAARRHEHGRPAAGPRLRGGRLPATGTAGV